MFTIAITLLLYAQDTTKAPRAMTCPDTVVVTESAAAAPGWSSQVRQTRRKLANIAIANKDAAGEYQLAPDSEKQSGKTTTQTWNLKDYRTMKIVLSCSYHDTSVTLTSEIPAAVATCTFRFALAGKELEQPEIICR